MLDVYVEVFILVFVFLVGVLLKLGIYGLLRFGLNMFFEVWVDVFFWLVVWVVVSVIYGLFNAIV